LTTRLKVADHPGRDKGSGLRCRTDLSLPDLRDVRNPDLGQLLQGGLILADAVVERYELSWHPEKGSAYRIKPVGYGWSEWFKVSASDLAAIAAIFANQPVFYHPDKSLTTGPDPAEY
jgi:hypothetical protein